jgi:hypothetical protein
MWLTVAGSASICMPARSTQGAALVSGIRYHQLREQLRVDHLRRLRHW